MWKWFKKFINVLLTPVEKRGDEFDDRISVSNMTDAYFGKD